MRRFFIVFFCLLLFLLPSLESQGEKSGQLSATASEERYVYLTDYIFVHSAAAGQEGKPAADQKKRSVLDYIENLPTVILGLVTYVLLYFMRAVLNIFTFILSVLIEVLTYNNFIYENIVARGWALVRDLANMFFVLILLAIAIGTILNIETYNYKRALPKFFLMAILINFSKVISGLFIDFAQVIALTFAYAVQDVTPAGVTKGFGLFNMSTLNDLQGEDVLTLGGLFSGVFTAFIFLIIATLIMAVYLVIFVFRIVMLWILIVLSPLSYLFSAWPSGGRIQQYAKMWWDKFFTYVFLAPVLMFFFWLSIVAMASGDVNLNIGKGGEFEAIEGASEFMTSKEIGKFIVTAALLVGGLQAAMASGAAGAGLAGALQGRLRGASQRAARLPLGLTKRAARAPWRLTKYGAGAAIGRLARSKRFSEGLANIVAGEGAFGKIARFIPFSRKIAGRAYLGLQGAQLKYEQEAKEFVRKIRGPGSRKVLQYYAHKRALSPRQQAIREAARNRDPSVIKDNEEFYKHVRGMSEEDFSKLSPRTIARISARAAAIGKEDIFVPHSEYLRRRASRDKQLAAGIDLQFGSPEYGKLKSPKDREKGYRQLFGGEEVFQEGTFKNLPLDIETKLMSDEEEFEQYPELRRRFRETEKMVHEQGMEFFDSEEFRQNQDKYVDQETFERLSAAVLKIEAGRVFITGSTKGRTKGVTLGTFAKGGRVMAVNFKQLAEKMGTRRLSDGRDFTVAAGLHTKGEDAHRMSRGLRNLLTEQRNRLLSAKTPEEQKEVLREFGYHEVKDEDLPKIRERVLDESQQVIVRLSDEQAIAQQGLNLINKEPVTFRQKPVGPLAALRHETRGHERWDRIDPEGSIRGRVFETLSDADKRRMKEGGRTLDEQVANAEAGILGEKLQKIWRTARLEAESIREGRGPYDPAVQARSEEAYEQFRTAGLSIEDAAEAYDRHYAEEITKGEMYGSRDLLKQKTEKSLREFVVEETPPELRDGSVEEEELQKAEERGRMRPERRAGEMMRGEIDRRSGVRKRVIVLKKRVDELSDEEEKYNQEIYNLESERDKHLKQAEKFANQAQQAREQGDTAKAGEFEAAYVRALEEAGAINQQLAERREKRSGILLQKEQYLDELAELQGDLDNQERLKPVFAQLVSQLTDKQFNDFEPRFKAAVDVELQESGQEIHKALQELKASQEQLQKLKESDNPEDKKRIPQQEEVVARNELRVNQAKDRLEDARNLSRVFTQIMDESREARQLDRSLFSYARGPETETEKTVFALERDNVSERENTEKAVASSRQKLNTLHEEKSDLETRLKEAEQARDQARQEMTRLSSEAITAAEEGDMDRAYALREEAKQKEDTYQENSRRVSEIQASLKQKEKEIVQAQEDYDEVVKRAAESAQEFSQKLHEIASNLSQEDIIRHLQRSQQDARWYQAGMIQEKKRMDDARKQADTLNGEAEQLEQRALEYDQSGEKEKADTARREAQEKRKSAEAMRAKADIAEASWKDFEANFLHTQEWMRQLKAVKDEREQKEALAKMKEELKNAKAELNDIEGFIGPWMPLYRKEIERLNKEKKRHLQKIQGLQEKRSHRLTRGDVGGVQKIDSKIEQEREALRGLDEKIYLKEKEMHQIEERRSKARQKVQQLTEALARGPQPPQARRGKREEKLEAVRQTARQAAQGPTIREAFQKETTEDEREALSEAIIKKNPEIQQNIQQTIQQGGKEGISGLHLLLAAQFLYFRKIIKDLADEIYRLDTNTKKRLGALGDKILALHAQLPQREMTPIEVKAVLDAQNISEDDLKQLLKEIS